MKKKLLIFSDCIVYSGSEKVIENLMLSNILHNLYEIDFVYGYNSKYHERFIKEWERLGIHLGKARPIKLLSSDFYLHQYRNETRSKLRKTQLFFKVLVYKILQFLLISHVANYVILRKCFKSLKPDLIFINNGGYPASLQCCIAALVAHSIDINKIIFNINNEATPRNQLKDVFIDRMLTKCVDNFVTASRFTSKQVTQTRNLPVSKFFNIPNTIFGDVKLKDQIPSKIKRHEEEFCFGTVGLLVKRKGYHILIDAVNLLVHKRHIKNFVVKIVGSGEELIPITNRIKVYHLEAYIKLLGFKDNPLQELADFDVFVLPSISNEDFPYVNLEAMLLSKPIIGTKVAGIQEQVVNNETGYLINSSNADDLADAMEKFLKSKHTEIMAMGAAARRRYFDLYNYEKTIAKYIALFE